MFTGTKTGNSTGGASFHKTGLSSMKFLGVNPAVEQINEWQSRDNATEPDYSLAKDYNGVNDVRPLNIWVKNDDIVTSFRINLGMEDAIAQSGNYQVCTSDGSVVWAKSKVDGALVLKPEFADHKPLKVGEADLIQFISKIINFERKSGENLYEQMTANKTDLISLFNGNYVGMNNLAKWCNENDKQIVMVLCVREKDTTDKDGNPVTKTYQGVVAEPKTWFSGEVTDWAVNKVKKDYIESLEVGAGQTKAYPTIRSTELFTYNYQDFKKEDCVNAVPDNPTPATTGGWKS